MPGPPQASVLIRGPERPWSIVGGEAPGPGLVAEGLTCSVNESGPDTASFTIRRRGDVLYPDLSAFAPVEIWIGGARVWGGRVWEAPISDTDEDSIAVQCRGWQYHLDDDVIDRFWTLTDLTAFRDTRSYAGANLARFNAGAGVTMGAGLSVVGWPSNSVCGDTHASGITLDLGMNRTPKRIVVQWSAAAGNGAFQVYARSHSTEDPLSGSTSDAISVGHETLATTPAVTTSAGTFGTGYRYVTLMMVRDDGAVAAPVAFDHLLQIRDVKLFAQTRDESGNASVLKASNVIRDVLASGALPQLSSDTSGIEATSFSIPAFAPDGYQTPRALMTAVNAYENKLLGVDAAGRVFYRARPTVPSIEVGAWAGSSFQDASTNSGEALYNRVYGQATAPDGTPVRGVAVTGLNVLGKIGVMRTFILNIGSAVDLSTANQICGLWIAEHEKPPMKGSVTVQGPTGVRRIHGAPLQPSQLLLRGGDVLRLAHLVDPATGGLGRDATIRSVSYSLDTDTATIELDNERGRLETLLERLAVVTAQVLR